MTEDLLLTPEDAALLVRVFRGDITMTDTASPLYTALRASVEAHAKLVTPPLNGDKVWCGLTTRLVEQGTSQNQSSTIVRAKSKAEAKRMLEAAGDRQGSHFDTHWSVTGNREQLAQATDRGVWAKGKDGWVKVWPAE